MTVLSDEIERGGGKAVWAQIADALREKIVSGEYAPGAAMPTEAALATLFDVNRHTVRRAIRHLVEGGLVRVEQGRGSFVSESVLNYVVGRRTRFSESLSSADSALQRILLFADKVRADKRLAENLALPPGASVWRLELLGTSDDRPISVASHYFSARRFPDFPSVFETNGTISKALAAMGVPDYTRQWTRITAVLPDPRDAQLLQQPRARPVLRTDSVNLDGDGRPIEYGRARFAGDRIQLLVGEGI